METKKFKELVEKGKIGEKIVKEHLIENGNIIYETNFDELDDKFNKSHPFDYLVFNMKEGFKIIEVKTISSRIYYKDTGISHSVYLKYKELSQEHKLPIYIYFVDKEKKEIYGNLLSELEKECEYKNRMYPKIEEIKTFNVKNTVIFFPLSKMKLIKKLDDKVIEDIKIDSKYIKHND